MRRPSFRTGKTPIESDWRSEPRKTIGTLVGVAFLILGAYLPWLQHNPWYDSVGIFIIPIATSWGIGITDLLFLFPATVVLVALAIQIASGFWAWTSLITGLWAILLQGLLVLEQYVNHNLYYIPDVGWGLTVLGGSILALVGGYTLFGAE